MANNPETTPPGHTDLMVSPESIDAFLAENPLPPDTLIPVVLTASRWKRIAACLDWHGKDHESELIVDAIMEQTGDD